jgi:hypothetical protein
MRAHAGQRGQVLPLIAVSLAVLMGFAGIAVDVAYLEYRQQTQQTATDAAAAGGAEALVRAGCPNPTVANAAALANATNNGFVNGTSNVTVTPNNPPTSGPFANNPCAVSVNITTQHVATFFSRLFGYANGMPESTLAVAEVSSNGNACVYLLSMSTQSDLSNAHLDAPGCGIIINDTANMSTSSIDALTISYSGPPPNISGATFAEGAPEPALPSADPCPRIAGCNYLANNPPSTSGCSAGGSYNNATLSPGCYDQMSLSGTDTLKPGEYVINGQFHVNNATVTGSGVTFYMTSNVQDTNFSNANLTLSPPTSGSTDGVLFYRNPAQSSALDLSTCTCNFSGLLYFPTTQVNYSNAGGNYVVLIFGSANFSTSKTLDLGKAPTGQSLVSQAVVAE